MVNFESASTLWIKCKVTGGREMLQNENGLLTAR